MAESEQDPAPPEVGSEWVWQDTTPITVVDRQQAADGWWVFVRDASEDTAWMELADFAASATPKGA